MNDEIAGGEARHFRYEILELAACLARPHQAVAENVLLADDGDVVGLETGLHVFVDQGDRAVLEFARGVAFGVDVGDFLQL